jgi:hypothetical protein
MMPGLSGISRVIEDTTELKYLRDIRGLLCLLFMCLQKGYVFVQGSLEPVLLNL